MMVLSRKVDEVACLILPDDKDAMADLAGRILRVMVVSYGNGKVRLGFRCPAEVKVLREELVSDEQRRRDEYQSRQ